MGTLQLRLVLLTTCLLLPACYGQYVVAHEIAPPGDIWIDPHRSLALSMEGDQSGLEVPLEARSATVRGGVCLLFVPEAMLDDPAGLRRIPCSSRSPLALVSGSSTQSVLGVRPEPADSLRLWTERVSLTPSSMGLFLSAGFPQTTPATEGDGPLRAVVLRMPDHQGLYHLEPREAERIGLASSSLLGIGIVGILSIWLGTQ